MHKKSLKFAPVVELGKLKFTYITVVKQPKLGHIEQSVLQTVLSRSSGPWHIKSFYQYILIYACTATIPFIKNQMLFTSKIKATLILSSLKKNLRYGSLGSQNFCQRNKSNLQEYLLLLSKLPKRHEYISGTKGQLISEGNFGAFKYSKKRTRIFALASKIGPIQKNKGILLN